MLIKYYAVNGNVHIIEDVTDVTVLANYPGDSSEDVTQEYIFDDPEVVAGDNPQVARVVQYAKDGPCRLFVFGTAYICSNEGKTLEKVIPGPLVV